MKPRDRIGPMIDQARRLARRDDDQPIDAERIERDMVAALEADGEKLRQLTGDDHGPFWPVEHTESPIIAECDCCGAKHALTRCWLGDRETFACDECRGARD
jgi:hypothetical protein